LILLPFCACFGLLLLSRSSLLLSFLCCCRCCDYGRGRRRCSRASSNYAVCLRPLDQETQKKTIRTRELETEETRDPFSPIISIQVVRRYWTLVGKTRIVSGPSRFYVFAGERASGEDHTRIITCRLSLSLPSSPPSMYPSLHPHHRHVRVFVCSTRRTRTRRI
jgi:hypothetical protein